MKKITTLKTQFLELIKISASYVAFFYLVTLIMSLVNLYLTKELISFVFDIILKNAKLDVLAFGTILSSITIVNVFLYLLVFTIIGIAIFIEYFLIVMTINTLNETKKDNKSVRDLFSVKTIYSIVKKINYKSFVFIVFYFVFVVSLASIPITNSFLDNIKISSSITKVVYSKAIFAILYLMFKLLMFYVAYRLSMFIIILTLESCSYSDARKKNKDIVEKNYFYLRILFLSFLVLDVINEFVDIYVANEVYYDLLVSPEKIGFSEYFIQGSYVIFSIIFELMPLMLIVSLLGVYRNYHENAYIDKRSIMNYKPVKVINYLVTTVVFALLLIDELFILPSSNTDHNHIMVHRGGGNEVVENSLESIDYSIENEFTYVEIDTIELKDGTVILAHDTNLNRLSGVNVELKDLTYPELMSNYKLLSSDGTEYEFITLDQALTRGSGKIKFNIELKFHGFESDNYEDSVMNLVETHGLIDDVYISSFDYDSLMKIEDKNSNFKTMFFTFYIISDVDNLRTDALGMDIKYVSQMIVTEMEQSEKEFAIYTVNTKEEMFEVFDYNPDFIITDEPKLLKEIKEAINARN